MKFQILKKSNITITITFDKKYNNQHKTNNSRVNELKSLVNPVLKVTNIHTNHSSQTYTFSSKNINKAPSCID